MNPTPAIKCTDRIARLRFVVLYLLPVMFSKLSAVANLKTSPKECEGTNVLLQTVSKLDRLYR
jgi:hypothetical protein